MYEVIPINFARGRRCLMLASGVRTRRTQCYLIDPAPQPFLVCVRWLNRFLTQQLVRRFGDDAVTTHAFAQAPCERDVCTTGHVRPRDDLGYAPERRYAQGDT